MRVLSGLWPARSIHARGCCNLSSLMELRAHGSVSARDYPPRHQGSCGTLFEASNVQLD